MRERDRERDRERARGLQRQAARGCSPASPARVPPSDQLLVGGSTDSGRASGTRGRPAGGPTARRPPCMLQVDAERAVVDR